MTRYVAPGYPALALLAAKPFPRLRSVGLMLATVLIGYGMINIMMYMVVGKVGVADLTISSAGYIWNAIHKVPILK